MTQSLTYTSCGANLLQRVAAESQARAKATYKPAEVFLRELDNGDWCVSRTDVPNGYIYRATDALPHRFERALNYLRAFRKTVAATY